MDLLADLEARDLVADTTDREALRTRLAEGPVGVYYGCDPTADSLHVGNLIGLVMLRRFQDAGHRPIALAGGATGMVGDPSGRSDERNLLDEDTLAANVAAISDQIGRVLGDGGRWDLVDNRTWTEPMGVLEFLRDVGKHVTVNQMVARETVKARMAGEHGISYTEFSYMLLQANDYRWLHDHMGCELQLGGSDQWGNILGGVDLVRRTRGVAVHGLCWSLLTAPDGTKLGKTTGARVWLDRARTSPYRFFQHFVQTDDRQVREHLARFTFLPMDEVERVAAEHETDRATRPGARRLAQEVTTLVHGEGAARTAAAVSDVLFGRPLDGVDDATLAAVAAEVPTVVLARTELDAGLDPAALLARTSLVASNGEARRVQAQGGLRLNGVAVASGATVGPTDLLHDRWLLLRKGKRDHALIEVRG